MTDPLASLENARRMAIGVDYVSNARPPTAPQCSTEADFNGLVTEYYRFFREAIAVDVAFLQAYLHSPAVSDFDRAVYYLRTAAQHTDNADAARFRTEFLSPYDDWLEPGRVLAQMFARALTALARAAVFVSRDNAARVAWREKASVNVGTIFAEVASDLGRRFTEKNRARMVRQVETRLRVHPPSGEFRTTVQDYCVQEIVSSRQPLPVPYFSVLDYLGLIGEQEAGAALLLAYSVAAVAAGLSGDEFLRRVDGAWRAAAPN